MRPTIYLFLAAAVLGTGLTLSSAAQTSAAPAKQETFKPIPGFDSSAMDTTADPCNDFYQYACGNFAKLHPIPSDMPMFDQFINLYEYNVQALHGLIEKAAATHAPAGSNEQKIGDYYQACLDTSAIDSHGVAPLEPELKSIDGLTSKQQLPELIAHLNKVGVGVFFDFGSQQDFKDATKEIAYIDQSGLGLPEKDYYFRTDAKSVEIRKQYVQHLANMLHLLGDPEAKASAEAQQIMDLETALAKVSMGNVERRDPENIYHMMAVSAVSSSAPAIDLRQYIHWMGAPAVDELNVTVPGFFTGLSQTIDSTSLDTIKSYLRAHLADSFADRLPHAFDEENFDFYSRKLTGTPEQSARWKRCVNGVDGSLGEALGKLYVQQYFTPDMKSATLGMVHDIEGAMDKDLDQLDWMSPDTKVKAKEKLHAVADKIGYPDKWRDYSKLDIKAGDALGNTLRARAFETAYQLDKIGKPVNRDEWQMTPPTINAYYDDSMNDINFPAGILQPPFYDPHASAASNYGHIGAIVGHELTHGFDDQGAKFDAKGNLHNWWTPEDKKNFDERTACVSGEYGQFTAVDDVKVNGKLTLGENTADNGGLRLAYMALLARTALTPGAAANGKFTPEQQFFLGYAQNWCTNERPEFLRMLANVDPHSPDALRVKGVLVNMPEFSHAFSCKTGQPMDPAKKCRVW
ncbi:M13 family metallopeptidase [Paracidobacterium acidisoli]|uniref:M13 family peptidase n=1 Tax=Paracidobacterium acidisoli TaxID=2303751 RepID=A0A372IMC2_9BACT|nr:M13 family metallopeptidase [Paracidobacterium acidisoli]MBT9331732.1 M13 family metallopeptidase [Paracidobacterium acidisoli]